MGYSPDLVGYWNWAREGNDDLYPDSAGLGPKLEIVRNSPAWRLDRFGRMIEAPAAPNSSTNQEEATRIDHDPSDGFSRRGLLVEDSSSQQVRWSNTFDNWGYTGPIPVISAAPSLLIGQSTWDKENEAGQRSVNQSKPGGVSINPGGVYTASFYLRKESADPGTIWRVQWTLTGGLGAETIWMNGNTNKGNIEASGGAVNSVLLAARNEPAGVDIEGREWRRVSLTIKFDSNPTNWSLTYYPIWGNDGSSPNGNVGIVGTRTFQCGQVEEQSIPTSWIESAASENVIRPADVVDTSDMAWYPNGIPATIAMSYQVPDYTFNRTVDAGTRGFYVVTQGASSTDRSEMYEALQTGNNMTNRVQGRFLSVPVTSAVAQRHNAAVGYNTDDRGFYINGTGFQDAAVRANFSPTSMQIGKSASNPSPPIIIIEEFRVYDTRRPDTGAGSLEDLSNRLVTEDPDPGYSSDLVGYWNWQRAGNDTLDPDDPALGPKMTIVRNAPAHYFNTVGLLAEADPAANDSTNQDTALRIDHNPLPATRRGCLIEHSSSQALRYSNDFLNVNWQYSGTPPAISAFPSVLEVGDCFEKLNDAGQRSIGQGKPGGVPVANGDIWTFSVYVRRPDVDTGTFFRLDLNMNTGADVASLCANQFTGNIEFLGIVLGSDLTVLAGRMEPAGADVGGGVPQWWRAVLTVQLGGSPLTWSFTIWPARGEDGTAPNGNVASNVGKLLTFACAQAEKQPVPTSWIESAGAENVIRQADVVQTTDMSFWPTGQPCTYYLDQEWYDETIGGVLNPGGPITSGVAGTDPVWVRGYNDTTAIATPFSSSGSTIGVAESSVAAGAAVRTACGFANADSAAYIEGTGATNASSNGANGAKTSLALFLSNTYSANRNLGGWVKQVRVYDTRRANTGLDSLFRMSLGGVSEDPGVLPGYTIGYPGTGFIYGFRAAWHATNSFGDLIPPDAFGEDVYALQVNISTNVVALDFGNPTNGVQPGGRTDIQVAVEGTASIIVSWTGSRYEVVDSAFTSHVIANVGNTLDFTITDPVVAVNPYQMLI